MSQKEFESQTHIMPDHKPLIPPEAESSVAPVSSPCVSICALNDKGFCIGCYRDGNEIRLWNTYSEMQKRQVLNSCLRRATLDQAFIQSSIQSSGSTNR